jgi:hypothetical protein
LTTAASCFDQCDDVATARASPRPAPHVAPFLDPARQQVDLLRRQPLALGRHAIVVIRARDELQDVLFSTSPATIGRLAGVGGGEGDGFAVGAEPALVLLGAVTLVSSGIGAAAGRRARNQQARRRE